MIKTIIFDFGGVLGSDADDFGKKFADYTGITYVKLKKIYNLHVKQLNLGKKSLNTLFIDICKNSKKDIDVNHLKKLYESNISKNSELIRFAKRLNKKFDIMILSNESREGIEMKIRKFKLNGLFSKIYCSAILGMAKPDKKIFEYILNDLKINPKKIVFIDDRIENIESARNLKINGLLYKNLNQFKKELSLLIDF